MVLQMSKRKSENISNRFSVAFAGQKNQKQHNVLGRPKSNSNKEE